ncbi:hypothetical protein [Nannocystis pusilla]|uniref:hypothetical protein n=1 Tax=Nannocystis pusilla TaxID=889268 RepID=UPI003DA300A1
MVYDTAWEQCDVVRLNVTRGDRSKLNQCLVCEAGTPPFVNVSNDFSAEVWKSSKAVNFGDRPRCVGEREHNVGCFDVRHLLCKR